METNVWQGGVHDTGDQNKSPSVSSRSTISSFEEAYFTGHLSDLARKSASHEYDDNIGINSRCEPLSIGVMGNFVPVETQIHDIKPATTSEFKPRFKSQHTAHKLPFRVNPYTLDHIPPRPDQDHQIRLTNFISSFDVTPYSSPQSSHSTTYQSQGQRDNESLRPTSLTIPIGDRDSLNLRRSDSSPSMSQQHFPARTYEETRPAVVSHDHSDGSCLGLPEIQRRPPSRDCGRCDRQPIQDRPSSPPLQVFHASFSNNNTHSPELPPLRYNVKNQSFALSDESKVVRSLTASLYGVVDQDKIEVLRPLRKQLFGTPGQPPRSPIDKMLIDRDWKGVLPEEGKELTDTMSEREQTPFAPSSPNLCSYPASKRSRSPMKKMFGEHGWLGNSPSEINQHKFQVQNAAEAGKIQTTRHNKTTMMGKIKTKLEEIAEKADLNPLRNLRSDDKFAKISVLAISLGPPEQARILMEIELMLVHSANSFIMGQFSQGRMAVDTIKKIVDMWKSKGRPPVTEFMYDQATQRELVVANQHNFRFHGDMVIDDARIASMLYNWKTVSSLMAIRIFCVADTVLLKLIFDVEQILELLGSAKPILLRLQAIRAVVNEMIRIACQKRTQSISRSNSGARASAIWSSTTASNQTPHRSQPTRSRS